MNNNDKYAYKPIQENPIILDFTDVKHWWEIYALLKEKFGLPDACGENWDAIWDCLDGLFDENDDFTVKIYGFNSLDEELRDYCSAMLEIFDDIHKETPNITFELIS